MATFEAQVEGLTGLTIDSGSNPSQSELTQFLQDGVIEVTERCILMNPQDARLFQTISSEQTSNGSYTAKGKILSVIREAGTNNDWRECREINNTLQSKVTNPRSLEYATARHPVFMMEDNGKISVFPAASGTHASFKVLYIANDPKRDSDAATLEYNSEDIRNFPKNKVYLVALYASIKSLQTALSNKTKDLPTTMKTFTMPELSLTLAPTISDLTIKSVAPVPPVLSNNSISFSTTAPTFEAPVVSPDFDDANIWVNTEEDEEMLAARMQVIDAQLNEYGQNIQKAVQEMNKENIEYQAELNKAIEDAKLSSRDDGQKLENYSAELNSYQASINKEVAEYQQTLAKEIQLFQTKRQTEIQKYTAEIEIESQKVSSSVQQYQSEVAKAQADYQWMNSRMVELQEQYNTAFMIMRPKQKQGE